MAHTKAVAAGPWVSLGVGLAEPPRLGGAALPGQSGVRREAGVQWATPVRGGGLCCRDCAYRLLLNFVTVAVLRAAFCSVPV